MGCWGSSCSVTAMELEGAGTSSDHTSALPVCQGFVWDTPTPAGGCGGLRVTHTSLFAAHVDLLRGLKVRPPQSLRTQCCLPHTTAGRFLPFALPSIAEQQEGVKHPSKEWSPSISKVPQAPVHEQEPCALQSATCCCPWISSCMGHPLAPVQSP